MMVILIYFEVIYVFVIENNMKISFFEYIVEKVLRYIDYIGGK